MIIRNRIMPLAPLLAPLLALTIVTSLAGCAGPSRESPMSEWTFTQGEAFRAQRDAQTLNPGPAGDDPVVGLDGRVTERAMKNMRDGEKKADGSNTVRFKIGK
ncbi:hypothetical protein [Nitratidesulfovibrio sp. 1201_IL3209]|uniref:hypothetical protein n=1 Tax=Nitratidesulfovibrio sp. 1201_IL3209 TaxID=3084053 RepID=UPI002FDACE16